MDSKNIVIVSTSINPPTTATKKFANLGVPFIIVGDLKTPHDLYKNLSNNVIYLTPEYQEQTYKELSDIIGWNTIQRRNFGFIEAYKRGYDIIASVDDDNIPYDNWLDDIRIGLSTEVDLYDTKQDCFDPLSVTNYPHLWHRGYPIQDVPFRKTEYIGKTTVTPLIQSNLWDGDPDIDSICRLTYKPICKFNITSPYMCKKMSPFNSQNTFLHRSVIPYYMMLPFIGRMDDIWGSYILQNKLACNVIFHKPTVYQDRNNQCLIRNMENELLGYKNTLSFIKNIHNYDTYLPEKTIWAYNTYKNIFKLL